MISREEKYMKMALRQAMKAQANNEVPIGAVIVKDDKVIARGYNSRNRTRNAVNHAEIVAIQSACKRLADWRLCGCEIYVTLEPCLMCIGACYNARISKVVFGAFDKNGGGATSVVGEGHNTLNHSLELVGGVLEKECSETLKRYFAEKRE